MIVFVNINKTKKKMKSEIYIQRMIFLFWSAYVSVYFFDKKLAV